MYPFKTEVGVNGLNGLLARKHAKATIVQRLREKLEAGHALARPQAMEARTVKANQMMLTCATKRFPALVMNTFMESYLIRFPIKSFFLIVVTNINVLFMQLTETGASGEVGQAVVNFVLPGTRHVRVLAMILQLITEVLHVIATILILKH